MKAFLSLETDNDTALNTLVEIKEFLGDKENTVATNLIEQINSHTTKFGEINDQIGEINNQIIGLSKQVVIPVEELEGFEQMVKQNDGWPIPSYSVLSLGQLYSKKSIQEKQINEINTVWWNPFNYTKYFTFDAEYLDENQCSNILSNGERIETIQYYDENNDTTYKMCTYKSETYPIAYYKLTSDFSEEIDDIAYEFRWFGLLYLKIVDQKISLHFTCSKHNVDETYVEKLDQYEGEIGENYGVALRQYNIEPNNEISIEDIVNYCLKEEGIANNINIQFITLIYDNFQYLKSRFLEKITLSSTVAIETQEIKCIISVTNNDNTSTKTWSKTLGTITNLPQWQTF